MKYLIVVSLVIGLVAGQTNLAAACVPNQVVISNFENDTVPEDSLININIKYNAPRDVNKLKFAYGSCNSQQDEQVIGEADVSSTKPTKFSWATPNRDQNSNPSCIKVYQGSCLVGQGKQFTFVPTTFDYKDEDNAWRYDAVKDFKESGSFVANQSPKSVGIVGAGMSGMFSALLFNMINLNYKIEMLESNDERVGGRIWTYKFPDSDRHDYHELGAMRLFRNLTFPDGVIREDSSTKIVFKLIDYLNGITSNQADKLNLIPFVFGKTQISYYDLYHNWVQVEDGMNRLPNLLRKTLVQSQTDIKHGKVYQLSKTDKVNLKYKSQLDLNQPDFQTNHDYAVVSVPLTLVRFWDLPQFSAPLTNIINNQHYARSCKVLLKFENKFWDSNQFIGQQYTNDKSVLRTTVYPSHGNSKVIIASYVFEDRTETQEGATIEEFEMLAIDDLVKIHGDKVRQAYKKGSIKRHCWHLDPNSLGGFAHYSDLNKKTRDLPPFANMESNTVFTVDSTDHRSGWIGGALNAALRGVLQILVKDGNLDEARKLNQIWGSSMYHI